jgi:hypothetical protein
MSAASLAISSEIDAIAGLLAALPYMLLRFGAETN